MERNIQKNGLVNLLTLLAISAASFAVARYANSQSEQVAAFFLGLGVLVGFVSYFQMRLEERERLEKLEFDEITKVGSSSTLFNTQEAEAFPARRSREQFERFFIPGFTIILFLLQAGGAFWIWRSLQKTGAGALNQPMVAMGILGIFAIVLFLMGKYSAGLARLEKQRLLRPGASFLLLGAYLCALVVGALVAHEAGFPAVDRYLALGLCVLLGLLAVETLIGLLLEIYRPRVKGKVGLLLYESRVIGLLSQPEGLFTTAAHALDYQFGFKVSDTWFYRFLEKALAWLLLAQLGILLLSTSFVFIEAGEEALLERFGRPVAGREVVGPGFHLKFPWPVDRVHRVRTQELQSFTVGIVRGDEHKQVEEAKTLLWTVSHYKEEFNLLVASRESATSTNNASGKKIPPVNLLSVSIPVQYQIRDLRAWAYHYHDAGALLEKIGTREVVNYLVSIDLNDLMSSGRFQAGQELRERMQTRADELKLGVDIVFVGLQDVHPPVKVAASYEAVVGARQKREANILNAQAYRARTNALADADAFKKKAEAEADRQRAEAGALARAALFTNQIPAYKASPAVYGQRAYLQALTRGGSGARKVILTGTNMQEIIQLNLEDKIRQDLLDIQMPTPKAK